MLHTHIDMLKMFIIKKKVFNAVNVSIQHLEIPLLGNILTLFISKINIFNVVNVILQHLKMALS